MLMSAACVSAHHIKSSDMTPNLSSPTSRASEEVSPQVTQNHALLFSTPEDDTGVTARNRGEGLHDIASSRPVILPR